MTLTGPRSVVLAVLDLARAGRFAEIRERFTPGLRPMVTAEALKAAWDAEAARLGPVASARLWYGVVRPGILLTWRAQVTSRATSASGSSSLTLEPSRAVCGKGTPIR